MHETKENYDRKGGHHTQHRDSERRGPEYLDFPQPIHSCSAGRNLKAEVAACSRRHGHLREYGHPGRLEYGHLSDVMDSGRLDS